MREKVLNEKLIELSKIMTAFHNEQATLVKFKELNQRLNGELSDLCNQDILDITKIGWYKEYLKKLGQLITAQENLIKKIENVVQLKQAEVNIAMQDKKIMEKLKEKEENKYYNHIEYLERQEIDDIAINRYKRNQV